MDIEVKPDEKAASRQPLRHLDPDAHEPGCRGNMEGTPWAEMDRTHLDLFCDCHRYTEPRILSNGTDIAWPAGWDEAQAAEWRASRGLARPVVPPAVPQQMQDPILE